MRVYVQNEVDPSWGGASRGRKVGIILTKILNQVSDSGPNESRFILYLQFCFYFSIQHIS